MRFAACPGGHSQRTTQLTLPGVRQRPTKMLGSTEMLNVSRHVASIHPVLSFDLPPTGGNHAVAFAAAAGGADGDVLVLDGGLAMALTVADAARSDSIRTPRLSRNRGESDA